MKWIGQHIWDFISRFRTTVYFENLETSSETNVLVVDSDGKVTKNTTAAGDITSVTAGSGLTGGGSSGSVTLNIGAGTGIDVATNDISVDVSDFMTNGSDNRIVTATGTDGMNAEPNFSFDGSTATLTGVMDISPANDAGLPALTIDNDDVDEVALHIIADNTTANIVDLGGTALTTANGMSFDFNALTTGNGIYIDWDDAVTTDTNRSGSAMINLDYDKSGAIASGQASSASGLMIRMTDAATNVGTFSMAAIDVSVDSASTGGTVSNTIFKGVATDADTNTGLDLTVEDGGNDIILRSSADSDDYFKISTSASGRSTISTVQSGGSNTANLTLDIDGQLEINADGGTIELKDALETMGTFTTAGYAGNRKFTKTADGTHFEAQGDILYLGDGSTTQGDLCYLKENGEWGQADADGAATGDDADRDAMGMLAIALGTDPDSDGMLIRGVITMDYDLGDVGNPVYVSTTAGAMTATAPSASGDFVRVLGYCLDDTHGQMYFNPDNTWVEIA